MILVNIFFKNTIVKILLSNDSNTVDSEVHDYSCFFYQNFKVRFSINPKDSGSHVAKQNIFI